MKAATPLQPDSNQDAWESQYSRFETPNQEFRKSLRRLRKFGAPSWKRNWEVVELFCGRGSGLKALETMGFSRIVGVDISATLLGRYSGKAATLNADCRKRIFLNGSKDVIIIQGGLHHLRFPHDLVATLDEVTNALRMGGLVAIMEPWRTPFLQFVHFVARQKLARSLWSKLDAFESTYQLEKATYDAWLANGPKVLKLLHERFHPVRERLGWGKLLFVGRKK